MLSNVSLDNKKLIKKRNDTILMACKAVKKGENKKALNYYYTALHIQPSEKITKDVLKLEEKVIQETYPNEYSTINDKKYSLAASKAFSNLEKHFQVWPAQRRLTKLLENSQWDEVDSLWSHKMTSFLDPTLVGKYFMEKGRVWETFLLWQPLLGSCLEEPLAHQLAKELKALLLKKETFLLDGLGINGTEWLFHHMLDKQFRTIIHCHINYFIYEGKWKKGLKFYDEIKRKYKKVSWDDKTSQCLYMSLMFWRAFSYSGERQLVENRKGFAENERLRQLGPRGITK